MMIEISPQLSIDEQEIDLVFSRSSGPGGQNVNKVSTAVQLRFNLANSTSIPPEVKTRAAKLAGSRLTDEGILIIESKRYRSQEKNREEVIRKLVLLIQTALEVPKTRKATRPTITAKAARVDEKKKRGEVKRTRRFNTEDWE